jgi:predicted cobalt transporter CbtA
MKGYARFAAMIATSTVVMFGLMYLNTYGLDHVFFSETRSYMALVMGAAMAAVMLAFMLGMYPDRASTSASSRAARSCSVLRSGSSAARPRSTTCRT